MLRSLPWDGIVFLGSAGTGIILTVLLSDNQEKTALNDIYLVTFYVAFSLYGIIDIVTHFRKGLKCEKLVKTFSLGTALVVEAVLYILRVEDGNMANILQMATIVVAAISAFGAFFDVHANIVLGISLLLQGTWLLQISGEIKETEWIQIYFSWHLIIISLVFFILILVRESADKTGDLDNTNSKFSSLKSKLSNPSTHLTDTEHNSLDNSFLQKQMPVYSNTEIPSGLSVLPNPVNLSPTPCSVLSMVSNLDEKEGVESEHIRRSEMRSSVRPNLSQIQNKNRIVTSPLQQYRNNHVSDPAVSSHNTTRHSSVSPGLSRDCVSYPSSSNPVVSPAPSTTSTSLSLVKNEEGSSPDQIVYENTHLAPTPNIIESEPFDRISPIDEYNTLSRHVQSVRASIKLKESNIV